MSEPKPPTFAEEVYLEKDKRMTDLSNNLSAEDLDKVAEIQAKMEPYGGYTTAGLAVGAAGVSLEDMDTYHDVMHLQNHAAEVNRLVRLGERYGINPQLIADNVELQAKLANFPYNPQDLDKDEDLSVDDVLIEETWELAENLASKDRPTTSAQ